MKPKTMILMVVAVACGLGASYMTSRLIGQSKPTQEPTVPVLVAKVRVPAWQPIKEPEKLFEIKEFPEKLAPKNAIANFEDIKNQRLKNFLDEDKPVTQEDLVNKDMASLEAKLLPGQRATAIRVTTEQIIGGFILPGSRVDVLATFRSPEVVTKYILQNMLVLAADQTDKKDGERATILAQTVTLAATPEEGARLAFAANNGELRLLLRHPGDQEVIKNITVKLGDIDKPLAPGKHEEKTEEPKESAATRKSIDVPEVPEEKKDDPKLVQPGKEPPAPVEQGEEKPVEKKPAPKPQPEERTPVVRKPDVHVMRILSGSTLTKVVFPLNQKDPDEAPDEGDEDAPAQKNPKDNAKSEQPKSNQTPGQNNGGPPKARRQPAGS